MTAALRLRQADHEVEVIGADPPEATVSAVAAAVWYPYKALPEERVTGWGGRSLAVFTDLARHPGTGVYLRRGLDLYRGEAPIPFWREAVGALERCSPSEIPGEYDDGWVLEVPVIETPVYLAWLLAEVRAAGAPVARARIDALEEVSERADAVLNCTGLGARALVPDDRVRPVKGQVVLVRNPGLERFILDEHDPEGPTYVIPRTIDCVLGGTAEEDVWDTAIDEAVAADIVARCIALEPRLEDAEVLGHKAGLRPVRDEVRVEAVELSDGTVCIHNYGHGGAGITLSWGCADEVVRLLGAGESEGA